MDPVVHARDQEKFNKVDFLAEPVPKRATSVSSVVKVMVIIFGDLHRIHDEEEKSVFQSWQRIESHLHHSKTNWSN